MIGIEWFKSRNQVEILNIPNELKGFINLAHFKLMVKTAKKFSIVNEMCKRNTYRCQSYAIPNNSVRAHCQVTQRNLKRVVSVADVNVIGDQRLLKRFTLSSAQKMYR